MNSPLYDAANSLVAQIGFSGRIDSRHPSVQAVIDALEDIDAGAAAAEPAPVAWQIEVGDNTAWQTSAPTEAHTASIQRRNGKVTPLFAALTSAPAVPEAMHHTCEETSECLLCDAHAKRHQFEAAAATFGLEVLRITAQPDSPYWKIETQFAWECWTRSQLKGVQPGERGEG